MGALNTWGRECQSPVHHKARPTMYPDLFPIYYESITLSRCKQDPGTNDISSSANQISRMNTYFVADVAANTKRLYVSDRKKKIK